MIKYNNEIYHFGKKGMKWGHRNNQSKKQNGRNNSNRTQEVLNKIGNSNIKKDNGKTKRRVIAALAIIGTMSYMSASSFNNTVFNNSLMYNY